MWTQLAKMYKMRVTDNEGRVYLPMFDYTMKIAVYGLAADAVEAWANMHGLTYNDALEGLLTLEAEGRLS